VKISVITASYNSTRSIASTIDSVLSQEAVELEFLLIDGGSTDGTVDIIKDFADRDSRIRWISEPDNGIADAFNKGIKLASGDWVGIIGSDDQYVPGALQTIALAAEMNPAATVLYGELIRLDEEGAPLFTIKPSNIDKTIWRQMPVHHPATFIARKQFKQVDLFDSSLQIAMDYDLILRLYKAGANFVQIDKPITMMRYGGASDERCLDGLLEVRQIKIREGYPRWKANYWLAHRFFLEWIKKLLRRTGLHFMLKLHPRFRRV
jgi:glycosyltransferase involved in cell wall biosynthesis